MSRLTKFRKTDAAEMSNFRRTISFVVMCIGLVVLHAAPEHAHAHHSNAMFDKSTVRQVTVMVKEFQWTNPHIWIQVLVANEDGEKEEWSIEGGGPNTLFRRGWRPDTFKPGDIVELKFNPMHDGSNAGLFVGARFSNGETLGNW